MAILTLEQLKERLEHPNNLVNILGNGNSKVTVNHKKIDNGGRRPGDNNIPPKVRELAGTLAHFDTAKNVGESLGISPIQVHHLKHGNAGNKNPKPELKEAIEKRLGKVQDAALTKLLSTVEGINEDKVRKLKPRIQSSIAKDLASVVERTTKKDSLIVPVQFNIYAPRIKDEGELEIIEVN